MAGCCLHHNRHTTKEDIELGLNCRTVAFLRDGELCAIRAIDKGASRDIIGVGDSRGFIKIEGVVQAESRIIGTCRIQGIASRPGLRNGWGDKSCSSKEER